MDKKKKIKRLGIALCIIGAVLLLFSGYLIVSPNLSKGNKKEIDNAQATSEASIAEDDTSTENGKKQMVNEAVNTEDVIVENEKNMEASQSSEQAKEQKKSAHEINPEVYEWPCGKESFATVEEPEDVIYFAKNKELFDEIVEEFSQYEGKDVQFTVVMSGGELLEANNGVLEVKGYDLECIKNLLQDEYINFITVYDRGVIFGVKDKDFNHLIYSFDNEINPYCTVNISPHWWWQTGVGD